MRHALVVEAPMVELEEQVASKATFKLIRNAALGKFHNHISMAQIQLMKVQVVLLAQLVATSVDLVVELSVFLPSTIYK